MYPDCMKSTFIHIYMHTPSHQYLQKIPLVQKRQHLGGNFQHHRHRFSYILFMISNGKGVIPTVLRIFGFDFKQHTNISTSI